MADRRDEIIDQGKDRFGRTVVLLRRHWRHVAFRHPVLADQREVVIRAVETADIRRQGNTPGTEVLYGRGLGPSRWLAVVVAYTGSRGAIITAYPHRAEPRSADRL